MKYAVGSVAMAALLALVDAKAIFTNNVMDPVAGETFVVTWSNAVGPVKITLKNGPDRALNTVAVVGTGLSGNSFSWSVPEDLAPGSYALEIDDGSGELNYSAPFQLDGSGTASTSKAPVSSTSKPTGSTTSAPTPTTSSTSSTSTTSRTTTSPGSQNTNVPGAAGRVASPLALVLVTIAAMVYFN